jgi:hypothetical protein
MSDGKYYGGDIEPVVPLAVLDAGLTMLPPAERAYARTYNNWPPVRGIGTIEYVVPVMPL